MARSVRLLSPVVLAALVACAGSEQPTAPLDSQGVAPGRPGGGGATPPSTYAVIDLGSLAGTSSSAEAVNAGGDIVGSSRVNSVLGAFLKRNGSPAQDLGSLPGLPFDGAWDINTAGTVVGVSYDGAGAVRGFVWVSPGPMQALSTLGGCCSEALGINDAGVISGDAKTAGGQTHAVIWVNGVIQDIDPAGTESYAWDVNEAGQVVGQGAAGGTQEAFRWDATNGLVYLPGSGGIAGDAVAIDGSGAALGWSTAGSGQLQATRWASTTPAYLPLLGGSSSFAAAANSAGIIVGRSDVGTRVCGGLAQTAVFWPVSGGVTNLGVPKGVYYAIANDVNAGGTVVGTSNDCRGAQRAVRWTLP